LTESARQCLDDPSPLVRASAVWALSALSGTAAAVEGRRRLASETDPTVRAEWRAVPGVLSSDEDT
jgi:epoxyqueuosine reductase